MQPPGHKKVLGCAHSGVGGHIFRGKRARGGEIRPPWPEITLAGNPLTGNYLAPQRNAS